MSQELSINGVVNEICKIYEQCDYDALNKKHSSTDRTHMQASHILVYMKCTVRDNSDAAKRRAYMKSHREIQLKCVEGVSVAHLFPKYWQNILIQ
jgi:hypothetical protein